MEEPIFSKTEDLQLFPHMSEQKKKKKKKKKSQMQNNYIRYCQVF